MVPRIVWSGSTSMCVASLPPDMPPPYHVWSTCVASRYAAARTITAHHSTPRRLVYVCCLFASNPPTETKGRGRREGSKTYYDSHGKRLRTSSNARLPTARLGLRDIPID